jgi:glycosyltransferase involved in cell wall biosynthesis
MKKRILQIIPTLDRAGAEKQLCLLAAGLPRDEFDVHVCALTRGGPLAARLTEAGVPLMVIGKRWKLDPQAYWRLKAHVARLQPDLIHAWMFAANTYGYAAARACGIKHFVAGQRCVDPWKSRLQLAADRALARRCSRVVVNSEGVREFYVERGTPADRVQVIPNGVSMPEPTGTTRRQLLAELELPADSRLIGLIGRLWPQKRVKDAIWAADLLKVIRDDVHLLVIGDGPQRDRLRRYRDQCVIRDKVHFLGERGDVPRLLPHFDVLLSTSGYEGQSNVILEAMAAGAPVVATDIPGTRELVVPDVTGYLLPVGDRAAFAKHADRLLNDAALSARFAAAARQRVQNEFSVEKMIERHAALYRELLA